MFGHRCYRANIQSYEKHFSIILGVFVVVVVVFSLFGWSILFCFVFNTDPAIDTYSEGVKAKDL